MNEKKTFLSIFNDFRVVASILTITMLFSIGIMILNYNFDYGGAIAILFATFSIFIVVRVMKSARRCNV